MFFNRTPSEMFLVAGAVSPQSIAAAGNATTAWVQVPRGTKWAVAILLCGALGGGSEQLDLEQATSSGGAGAKAWVTNAATNAANNTNSKVDASIDTLDINGGFNFVRAKVTNTGGTGALVALSLEFGRVTT